MVLDELVAKIRLDTAGYTKGIKEVQSSTSKMANSVNKQLTGISSLLKKVAIGATLIKIGKSALEAASDLAEVQNVVEVAFGSATEEVNLFAQTAITQLGITEYQAKKCASTLMAMSNGMGIAAESGKTMAIQLTALSADMASFYNVSQDVAETALKSVFTGETESLKKFGVVMTEANLKAFALSRGITKEYSAMSQAEKVALRYNYVLNATKNAQGDYARTSDSWANQLRLLTNQWKQLMSILGQLLIKVLLPVLQTLNKIMAVVITLTKSLGSLLGISSEASAGAGLAESTEATADNLDTAAANAKKLKGQLAGFDELNKIESSSSSDSGVSSIGIGAIDLDTYFDTAGSDAESGAESVIEKIKAKFEELKEPLITIGAGIAGFFTALFGPSLIAGISSAFETLQIWALILIQDILPAINLPLLGIAAVVALVVAAFAHLMQTNEDFRNKVMEVVDDIGSKLSQIWNDIIKPVISLIVDMFKTLVMPVIEAIWTLIVKAVEVVSRIIMALWTNILSPITQFLIDIFAEAVSAVVEVWESWKPTIEKVQQVIAELWNKYLEPIVNWFTGVLIGVIESVGSVIKDVLAIAKDIFSNLIQFVKNVFTGNWKGAWENVKNILVTVFNAMKNAIKTPINAILGFINKMVSGVVSGLNSMIKAMNKLKFDVPSWIPLIGGKSFGFNLSTITAPQIPLLANGGVITSPTLAMMGEYRGASTNPEIVTPENKMREIFAEGNSRTNELLATLIDVVGSKEFRAYISDKEIGKSAVKYINSQSRIMGGALV